MKEKICLNNILKCVAQEGDEIYGMERAVLAYIGAWIVYPGNEISRNTKYEYRVVGSFGSIIYIRVIRNTF